jgi:hypothetical protein
MSVAEERAALLQAFTGSRAALLEAIDGLSEEQMLDRAQTIKHWRAERGY